MKQAISQQHSSACGYEWQVKSVPQHQVDEACQMADISPLVAHILVQRGVLLEKIPDYLQPSLRNSMPDPFHLIDMDKAAARVAKAIAAGEKVAVFGDYDVDGGTSSALLHRYFAEMGRDLIIYIPNRLTEGYGPSVLAMERLKAQDVHLVVTVDCGAVAFEAIEAAVKMGLEVVVIDHHLGAETLPNAIAVVNPNRVDEASECRYLAAVGVTFLLCAALSQELLAQGTIDAEKKQALNRFLMQQLDLAALGSVCDVMPLVGLNRAYVRQGLEVLRARQNLGLRALLEVADIQEVPTVYHLGFVLGPRINAGGRIGESDLGARLLTTSDYAEALQLAGQLQRLNEDRRAIEAQALDDAIAQAESFNRLPYVLCLSDRGIAQSWHAGVIGIVASRIKDAYDRPAAIIAMEDSDKGRVGKGSMRSVAGVDIGAAIANAKTQGLLLAGGGHAMAGGFTVAEEQIDAFEAFLNEHLGEKVQAHLDDRQRWADLAVTPDQLTLEFLDMLEPLQPFGVGNPEPKLLVQNAVVTFVDIMAEKHIRMSVKEAGMGRVGTQLPVVAFNVVGTTLGDVMLSSKGKEVQLVGKLKENRFNGRVSAQFMLEDMWL